MAAPLDPLDSPALTTPPTPAPKAEALDDIEKAQPVVDLAHVRIDWAKRDRLERTSQIAAQFTSALLSKDVASAHAVKEGWAAAEKFVEIFSRKMKEAGFDGDLRY